MDVPRGPSLRISAGSPVTRTVVGLLVLLFAVVAGVGSYFLAFGGYRLVVTAEELVFEYPGNPIARDYRPERLPATRVLSSPSAEHDRALRQP